MKLSANGLKWIAMLTMLLDHIGLALIEYFLVFKGNTLGMSPFGEMPWQDVLGYVGQGMRTVGRISFPLYCFLLTEGFVYTRSWKKYWVRLGAFALLSQIPFSLAVFNVWTGPGLNVYFELAVGILMLLGLRAAQRYYDIRRMVYMLLILVVAGWVSEISAMDYGMEGMLIMAAFYLFRDYKVKRACAGGGLAMAGSLGGQYGAGALAAVPVLLYSGERGAQWNRYIFYCFYPLHLMALFLIRRFLLGIPLNVTFLS